MPDLASILQRGYAGLLRYLPPYNPRHSRELLEEAALLLLARLLFLRHLEVRGLQEPQLGALLRGWQRIGRRRDLLVLLAGQARTLDRRYGAGLLAPATLDSLECEPTPVEPLLEALLDEALSATLADPLALAQAWERAFAPQPRPWSQATAERLVELVLPLPGRGGWEELPRVLDLAAGGGALLALVAQRLLGSRAASGARQPAELERTQLFRSLYGYECQRALRQGARLSLALAVLPSPTRLPAALPLGSAPPARPFDVALLYPATPQQAPVLLERASSLLRPGGLLGLLLPAEAAEGPAWAPLRSALFEGWSLSTIVAPDAAEPALLAIIAQAEPETARRTAQRIALISESRKATAIRQGALAALPGSPLRLALSEPVERALARLAAGRPLQELAVVWTIKPGSQPPERGARAVRASLPLLLLEPGPQNQGWRVLTASGWPNAGGLALQPLALLAQQRGAGVRLAPEEQTALAPYSLALLQAVLQSRLLQRYRSLILGRSGPLAAAELRQLPMPRIDLADQATQQELARLEAAVSAAADTELQVARLYGLTADELRAIAG